MGRTQYALSYFLYLMKFVSIKRTYLQPSYIYIETRVRVVNGAVKCSFEYFNAVHPSCKDARVMNAPLRLTFIE